jgi:gluconate 2-dehydrogenase gamma chain
MNDVHENDSPELLQRRAVLQRVAWLLGGAVSAPAALAILQGCSARDATPAASAWTPKFLKASQATVIDEIADIIIPKTDTSGAKDAGVLAFIDLMLADAYNQEAQARFNAGYDEFDASAKTSGKAFMDQERAQRAALVRQSLETTLAGDHDHKPFILLVRELTLLGFYTSRVGITENMEYVPVPTAYHGCVPLSAMKKPVYWE